MYVYVLASDRDGYTLEGIFEKLESALAIVSETEWRVWLPGNYETAPELRVAECEYECKWFVWRHKVL